MSLDMAKIQLLIDLLLLRWIYFHCCFNYVVFCILEILLHRTLFYILLYFSVYAIDS